MGTAATLFSGTAGSVLTAARMAAPFFQALLKNLPTIISVGHGLFSLFRQVNASRQENDRVVQAFQLLRNHQDDLDRFLADPERQRELMEGYSILLRRIQELQRDRRTGARGWDRRERFQDEGYGFRQIPYHDRDNGYRTKGEYTDDFRGRDNYGWRNNYRGGEDFRRRDDFGDDFRRENGGRRDDPREDLRRRRQESPRCSGAEGKKSKGQSNGIGGASPKIKAHLVCDVCKENYNSDNRRPILLPTCGHTFCHACLRQVSRREHLRCPVCRADPFMDVSSLPINRPILDLVIEHEGSDSGEDSGEACSSDDGHSCRNNAPNSRNANPSRGSDNPSRGSDNPSHGSDNTSCGSDNPSCGSDNPSCGSDNPSCGNGGSGWGDDSSSFTMMSFEEQIQLAIMWSQEEMRRNDLKDSSSPFAFLDQAERENEELARALSLSLIEAQNSDQNSRSGDEACCGSQCTETNDDDEEEEHIKLAIIMSLETCSNDGQYGGGDRNLQEGQAEHGASQNEERDSTEEFLARQAEIAEEEFQQALRCSREEHQLAQEPHFASSHRVDEVVQCGANTMEEHGRGREREELKKERERLKKEKEDLEREKEEWRKKATKQRNKDKAKQTLAGLGCFAGEHSKKTKSDGNCTEEEEEDCCSCDDCFKDNNCSTDDDDCCGKLKKTNSKEASCTESEDECADNDDLCKSNSDKLDSDDSAAECKKDDDDAINMLLWQEEERERKRRKKREWRKKKEEEQIQLAMALSLSLHEAETSKASLSPSE